MTEKSSPIDKSAWPDGPWKTEPDRKEWEHTGFNCLVVRAASHGALCGYVGVPPGHPWYGHGYDDISAECHGGLTYAQSCQGKVCHVAKPGESDDLWWLGFDHAHAWDLCPALGQTMRIFGEGSGSVYRDMEYVVKGVEALAEQALAAVKETK
jgi:hypothetical protein